MKLLNVKSFLILLVLFGGIYTSAIAGTVNAEENCNFISPYEMQDILQKRYPTQVKYYQTVDYLDYLWGSKEKDINRLKKCEIFLLDEQLITRKRKII